MEGNKMNLKKAYENLIRSPFKDFYKEELDVIKEYLEKEEPKLTILKDGYSICPTCKEIIKQGNRCLYCGQLVRYKND